MNIQHEGLSILNINMYDMALLFSEKEAEDEKNTGNNFYKQKDYFKAIKFYTNAINLMPEKAAYYGNRAAAYMMISNFSSALDDSLKSVEKDPNFFKVGY